MSPDLLLGVDVGTTGVRCVVFDAGLRVVASAYQECPPRYGPGGLAEQDPEEWLDAVAATVRSATSGVADRVRALAISSQGITLVPVDAAGAAVRPALSWLDTRADAALGPLASFGRAEWRRRTGKRLSGVYTLPKAVWLQREEPDAWARVAALLTPHDFVVRRLTGRTVTDPTLAGGTTAYAVDAGVWDPEILAAAGVDRALWPEVLPAGTTAGRLLPEAASRLGLSTDVLVAVGGQDQKCAALAAGLAPGVVTLSLGTSAALEAWASGPDVAECPEVDTFRFLLGDAWVREASLATAGAALRWLARTVAPGSDFPALMADAAASDPDAEGPVFLPYLGGATDAGSAPGAFVGLTLDTTRGDLVRAVVEGVTFELQRLLRALDSDATVIRAFGGGASSPFWCQAIADATGVRVEVLETHEAAAAGAALLAGVATGLWSDPADAATRIGRGAIFLPDPAAAGRLARRHERWVDLRARLGPT